MENNSLLDVQHLSHMFHLKRKMTVKAIDDVSFQIKKGEIYGLVGESGSGKSTVARCIMNIYKPSETSVYKGYKRDKIEMRGDRAEISDFPLYLNTVAGGLDCRDQTIGGFSFVVKIYAVPVVEIIG